MIIKLSNTPAKNTDPNTALALLCWALLAKWVGVFQREKT